MEECRCRGQGGVQGTAGQLTREPLSGAVNQADIFLLDSGGPGEQAGEITINMIKHC